MSYAIHLIITRAVPDFYINNLRYTRAFSNHGAVGTNPRAPAVWTNHSGRACNDNARFDLRQSPAFRNEWPKLLFPPTNQFGC